MSEPGRKTPCAECPWRRASAAGWTGQHKPETWVKAAHGDERIYCHLDTEHQCAGAAIYRANVCKVSKDAGVHRLPADRETVFSFPTEFLAHHKGGR